MKQLAGVFAISLFALTQPAYARGVPENPLHEILLETVPVGSLTEAQKKIILRSTLRHATDCVVDFVRDTDPELSEKIDDLIVEAMGSCGREMRVMIEKYNVLFGGNGGEAFFMGPYLDGLPTTVQMRIRGPTADAH